MCSVMEREDLNETAIEFHRSRKPQQHTIESFCFSTKETCPLRLNDMTSIVQPTCRYRRCQEKSGNCEWDWRMWDMLKFNSYFYVSSFMLYFPTLTLSFTGSQQAYMLNIINWCPRKWSSFSKDAKALYHTFTITCCDYKYGLL